MAKSKDAPQDEQTVAVNNLRRALARKEELAAQAEQDILTAIVACRQADVSWRSIGERVGVAWQNLHTKYGPRISETRTFEAVDSHAA